jgi:hypothetical protein
MYYTKLPVFIFFIIPIFISILIYYFKYILDNDIIPSKPMRIYNTLYVRFYKDYFMEILTDQNYIFKVYDGMCSDTFDINDIKDFFVKDIIDLNRNESIEELNIGLMTDRNRYINKTFKINKTYKNKNPIIMFSRNRRFAMNNKNVILDNKTLYSIYNITKNQWGYSYFRCKRGFICYKNPIVLDIINVTTSLIKNNIEEIVEKQYDCRNNDVSLMRELHYKRNLTYHEEIEDDIDCNMLKDKYKEKCIKYVNTKNITLYSDKYDVKFSYNNSKYTNDCMEYIYDLIFIRRNCEYYGDQKFYIKIINALC